MAERGTEIALTAGLLLLVGAMTFMAIDFNDQARRVPLVVGVPTSALLALQLVRSVLAVRLGNPAIADTSEADEEDPAAVLAAARGEKVEKAADPAAAPAASEPVAAEPAPPERRGEAAGIQDGPMRASALQAFGWVLLLAVSFYLIGMLFTVPVFFVLFMRFYGKESWRTITLVAVGTVVVIYLFFVLLLEVRLYQGVLPGLVGL